MHESNLPKKERKEREEIIERNNFVRRSKPVSITEKHDPSENGQQDGYRHESFSGFDEAQEFALSFKPN